MNPVRPFWESSYEAGDAVETFGKPSREVVELASVLAPRSRVLDLGCGEGRHSLFLAGAGHDVTAIDISRAGVEKLSRLASEAGIQVRTRVLDMREYVFDKAYDLIIAHGCLHLVTRDDWGRLLKRIQEHTIPHGYNVVTVFTDALPPPEDLRAFHVGLFREGELFDLYRKWETLESSTYVLEDEHPGNIRHRHPINKIVARKPG